MCVYCVYRRGWGFNVLLVFIVCVICYLHLIRGHEKKNTGKQATVQYFYGTALAANTVCNLVLNSSMKQYNQSYLLILGLGYGARGHSVGKYLVGTILELLLNRYCGQYWLVVQCHQVRLILIHFGTDGYTIRLLCYSIRL